MGPLCLAVHKGKGGWGSWEYYFSATSHKEILYYFQKSLSTNASCQEQSVLGHFDTAAQDSAVCYKIVVLDSVQEGWNWAGAVGLIFHTHVGANCGVSVVAVSSFSETVLSDTVHLKGWGSPSAELLGEGRGVCVCLSCAVVHAILEEGVRDIFCHLHGTQVDLAFLILSACLLPQPCSFKICLVGLSLIWT